MKQILIKKEHHQRGGPKVVFLKSTGSGSSYSMSGIWKRVTGTLNPTVVSQEDSKKIEGDHPGDLELDAWKGARLTILLYRGRS